MKNEADQSGLTFFAPHLTVLNVLAELNFCKAAFGALELRRFSNPDGSVHVAEMSIGGALFHIHEEMPGSAEMSPETLKGTSSGNVVVNDYGTGLLLAAGKPVPRGIMITAIGKPP